MVALSNTMDTFVTNLMEEIDESRTQMFDILENIAIEQQVQKQKKRKVVKPKIKPQLQPKKSRKPGQGVSASFLPKTGNTDERVLVRPSRDLT